MPRTSRRGAPLRSGGGGVRAADCVIVIRNQSVRKKQARNRRARQDEGSGEVTHSLFMRMRHDRKEAEHESMTNPIASEPSRNQCRGHAEMRASEPAKLRLTPRARGRVPNHVTSATWCRWRRADFGCEVNLGWLCRWVDCRQTLEPASPTTLYAGPLGRLRPVVPISLSLTP